MKEQLEKQREFNHAAMAYLRIWLRTDRSALARISTCKKNSDEDGMARELHEIAKKYKVVRGISARDDYGQELTKVERTQRWLEISRIVQAAAEKEGDSHVLVCQLSDDLKEFSSQKRADTQESYSLISLSSKLLWFFPKTKVKIYDSLAVKALKHEMGYQKNNGYVGYERCWKACIKKYKQELDFSIKELPGFFAWSSVPYELHDEACKVISRRWFRERVFDQYLVSRANVLPQSA